MHESYTLENEILVKRSYESIQNDSNFAKEICELQGVDTIDDISCGCIYNRDPYTRVPILEVEALMSNLIVTANRWKTLQQEGNDVTVTDVVNSVIAEIGMFDAILGNNYQK